MKKGVLIFGIFFIILSLNFVNSADITVCQTLNSPNTIYVLQNNVNSTVTCFTITAENVTLDLNGYEVVYGNQSSTTHYYGVYSNKNYTKISNGSLRRGESSTDSQYRYGIYLTTASNGEIKDITANSNMYGIYIVSSSNNTLTNITANSNMYGIYIFSSSDRNTLTDITANSNMYGIYIVSSSNNTLTNVTSFDNSLYGIDLQSSSNNTLTNVTSFDNSQHGIYISNSDNNALTSITANSNSESGIHLYLNSNNNILTDITANSNNYGIFLRSSSSNNILTDITANSNSWYGIYLYESSKNNFLTNITSFNNSQYGIYLRENSNNNILTDITANSNSRGIDLSSSSNNTLTNITANSNMYGIYAGYSTNNIFINSIIQNNTAYGVRFDSTVSSNLFYNNFFNNSVNWYPSTDINYFNTTLTSGTNIVGGPYIGGNYWAYPNGTGFSETCTDADVNGICDEEYLVYDIIYDYLPLIDYSDSRGPTISITYPTATSYTSVTSLNYTASDLGGVDYCWYSLNGGVTNSTPDSSCENVTGLSAAVGSHTWTVYANDSLGNENSDSVTFTISAVDDGGDRGSSNTGSMTSSTSSVTILIDGITAISPKTYPVEKEGIDLTKLKIVTNRDIQTASVSITSIDTTKNSDLFIGFSQDNIYQAFQIDKIGFTNDDLENVTFEFKVNKIWVENKDIKKIVLKRKEENNLIWETLETNFINEDDNYYYFNSISSGFSIFAIYFDEEVCDVGELVCVESNLHLCTSNRVLLQVQKCEYGCGYGRCLRYWEPEEKENILQRVGRLILGVQNKLGLVAFYIIVMIISLTFILVLYITLRYSKIKKEGIK
jgi:PGF-pre-PGF domain-containing protein